MTYRSPMNKTMTITAIVLVAVIMGMSAIIPAMAIRTSGTILSINPSEKHGVIERDVSGTLYQFSIPRDLAVPSNIPNVGDVVGFIVDPENSRHATDVGGCNPNVPPGCGSG